MKTYTLMVFIVGLLVATFLYGLKSPPLPVEMLAIIAVSTAIAVVGAWIHNPNRSPRPTGEVFHPKHDGDIPW